MAAFPDHNDRANVDAIAKALGWRSARIEFSTQGRTGWRITFTNDNGEFMHTHDAGVPGSQLRAWIDGAQVMRLLVERERADLLKLRVAGIPKAMANFTNEELVAAVKKRAEANSIDLEETFGDEIILTDDQLRTRCELVGVELWDDKKAREAGLAAMVDTPVFQLSARVAYAQGPLDAHLQAELRHALAHDYGLFNAETARLL